MFDRLKKFIDQCGWVGFVRLAFYPITVLVTTFVRLAQTLWACRVLLDGKWKDYNCFTTNAALNNLFYWTAALNISRYGRSGISPYLGLGSYPLSRWFFYSLPSLYAYRIASPIVPLAGIFGWLLIHVIWIEEVSLLWTFTVMGMALASTTFYANVFSLQNYNAAGWLFFPLGLYGLATENWLVAGLAWLAASFGSFTVVFLAGILSLVVSCNNVSIAPILAILPSGLKLLTHFWPLLFRGDLKKTLSNVMKSVGVINRKTKYKRKKIKVVIAFFLLLYTQFFVVSYMLTGNIPVLFLTGIVVYLLNSLYIRFADEQSIYMLMFSIATVVIMQNYVFWLLPSYWIVISPLPLFLGFSSMKRFDIVPKLAPVAITQFIKAMESFLAPVQKGQCVLMAFDDPKGAYEKIFDGYRTLLELPLFVAAKKEIHFMPDWWGVFETNYEGAPGFWGRDVDSVKKNIKQWKVDYVVVYQGTGTEFVHKWKDAGFEILTRFSWADYINNLEDKRPHTHTGKTPDWWLLKKPQEVS